MEKRKEEGKKEGRTQIVSNYHILFS